MGRRILVVDDERDMLEILGDFLTGKGYTVAAAGSVDAAVELLRHERFDLVLSDINMPGRKGFELIDEARRVDPRLKTALITAYDVADYLRLAKEHDVGNIIAKTTPFNFAEVELLIRNILTEEVFGLERYVGGPVETAYVTASSEAQEVLLRVLDAVPQTRTRRRFRQALGEIIINALSYGAAKSPAETVTWDPNRTALEQQAVKVSWGTDAEKSAVAVQDCRGGLTKKEVLFWLERNSSKGEDGLSRGLFDRHGKGLFITREVVDRLIINIKRDQSTEVVMLNYHEGFYDGYRPLWIHEF